MVGKIMCVALGFGMIAVGVTGIATSLVNRKTQEDLKRVAMARQETMAVAEETRKALEEERREVERLSQNADAERKGLGEARQAIERDRRTLDETYRSRMAVLETQAKAAGESAATPPGSAAKGRSGKGESNQAGSSGKDRKVHKKTVTADGHGKHRTTTASKAPFQDGAMRQAVRKAGFEAARFFQPVQYRNHHTGEMILAEPFDFDRGSVHVRVRVWKHQRLVTDTVMSYSEALLHRPGRPRV